MPYVEDKHFRHRIETSIDILTTHNSNQVLTVTHEYYEILDPEEKSNILTVRENPNGLNFITIDAQLIDRVEDIDKNTIRFYLDTFTNTWFDIKVGIIQRKEIRNFFYRIGCLNKCLIYIYK